MMIWMWLTLVPVLEDTIIFPVLTGTSWLPVEENTSCTKHGNTFYCLEIFVYPSHRRFNTGNPPFGFPDSGLPIFPRPLDTRDSVTRYVSADNPLGREYPLMWSWADVFIGATRAVDYDGDNYPDTSFPWVTEVQITVENVQDTADVANGMVFPWTGHLHAFQGDQPLSERPRGGFLPPDLSADTLSCLLQDLCPANFSLYVSINRTTSHIPPYSDMAFTDTLIYQASPVSGRYRIHVADTGGLDWMAVTFPVGIPDMAVLMDVGAFQSLEIGYFEGGTCRHSGYIAFWKVRTIPDPPPNPPYQYLYHDDCQWVHHTHWATPRAASILLQLMAFVFREGRIKARDSTQPDTFRVLDVNDISLRWGGLFDIHGDWSMPHRTHRTGRTVDIPYRLIRFPAATPWGADTVERQSQTIERWFVQFLNRICWNCFDYQREDALYHFHLWIDRGGAMLGYEDLYPVFR